MKIKDGILEFNGANVPISEVAKIMKKDKQFVRMGIQEKWLPIGVAYKKEGSAEYSYYVSPKKLYTNIPALFITINLEMCNRLFAHFCSNFMSYYFCERSDKYEITKWIWKCL